MRAGEYNGILEKLRTGIGLTPHSQEIENIDRVYEGTHVLDTFVEEIYSIDGGQSPYILYRSSLLQDWTTSFFGDLPEEILQIYQNTIIPQLTNQGIMP